jgi:hypothetical protein
MQIDTHHQPSCLPRAKIELTRLATVCFVEAGYESGASAGKANALWCFSPQFWHQASKLARRGFSLSLGRNAPLSADQGWAGLKDLL